MRYLWNATAVFAILATFVMFAENLYLQNKIKELTSTVKVQNQKISSLTVARDRATDIVRDVFPFASTLEKYSIEVTASAYTARAKECDETPWVTSNMTPSRPGILAISRDLESELGVKIGDTVILEGLGVFHVADRMNKRWKRRVDILHSTVKSAKIFGTKKQTTLTWVR